MKPSKLLSLTHDRMKQLGEDSWVQVVFAVNSKGEPVGELNNSAVSWCLDGHMVCVLHQNDEKMGRRAAHEFFVRAATGDDKESLFSVNDRDSTTFKDVLAWTKQAAELAKAEGE